MNFKISILLLFFVVSSCDRQEYDLKFYEEFNIPKASGKEVFDGDPEPERPPIEQAMQGVFGVDSDNDGVRDDVEIWINRYFNDPLKRKAYKEYYRHHALKLAYTRNEEREKLESFVDESDTFLSACLFNLYDTIKKPHKTEKDLDKVNRIFVNTRKRGGAYGEFIMYNRNIISSADWEKEHEYILESCPFSKEERLEVARKFKDEFDF